MTYGEEKMEARANLCDDCDKILDIDDLEDDALVDTLRERGYLVQKKDDGCQKCETPTRDLIVELERRNYSGICIGCRLDAINENTPKSERGKTQEKRN